MRGNELLFTRRVVAIMRYKYIYSIVRGINEKYLSDKKKEFCARACVCRRLVLFFFFFVIDKWFSYWRRYFLRLYNIAINRISRISRRQCYSIVLYSSVYFTFRFSFSRRIIRDLLSATGIPSVAWIGWWRLQLIGGGGGHRGFPLFTCGLIHCQRRPGFNEF